MSELQINDNQKNDTENEVSHVANVVRRYRCGWCGAPCQENGECLNPEEYKNWTDEDWNNVEKVHGECCIEEQNKIANRMQVTRDMAIDAGDPSLEGQYI